LEKSEFIYFMEKHVEYELEAFKQIFESFDEDGNLEIDGRLSWRSIRMFQWIFLGATKIGCDRI